MKRGLGMRVKEMMPLGHILETKAFVSSRQE